MKICPVCERKIEGRFCSRCFRFVTPWDVSDNTYINQDHDGRKDENCEYHNPKTTQYSRQEYMEPGYEKRIYGGTAARSAKKPSGYSKPITKKQSKNALAVVVGVCLLVGVIQALIVVGLRFWEEDHPPVREPESMAAAAVSMSVAAEEPAKEQEDSRSIKGYLQTISFVTKEESFLGTYYYYDPENIKGLTEYHCDYGHFDMTAEEFYDRFTAFYGEEPLEVSSEDGNNYMLDALTGDDTVFLDTKYEWGYEDFQVEVRADTASNEVHRYAFKASDASDEYYEMVYRWCEEEIPGRFASAEDMKNVFSENRGYVGEVTAEGVSFIVFQMGSYVSVEFGK